MSRKKRALVTLTLTDHPRLRHTHAYVISRLYILLSIFFLSLPRQFVKNFWLGPACWRHYRLMQLLRVISHVPLTVGIRVQTRRMFHVLCAYRSRYQRRKCDLSLRSEYITPRTPPSGFVILFNASLSCRRLPKKLGRDSRLLYRGIASRCRSR